MGNMRLRLALLRSARAAFQSNYPVFGNAPPQSVTQNTAYSYLPQISGGKAPFSYAVSGALPTGMSHTSSTGAITGTPTIIETKTNLVQTVTDALGRVGYQAVFQIAVTAPPSSVLPTPQTAYYGDQTPIGWGAAAPTYTGVGYLKITAGNTGSIFDPLMPGNKLVTAGTYGAAKPTFSGSYTLTITEYSDAARTAATGVTATLNVTVQANTCSVSNSYEWSNALSCTGGAVLRFGDDVRLRGGSYTGFYCTRNTQVLARGGGPSAPTTECAAGWIRCLPDVGANVVSIGAHTFYGTAATHGSGQYVSLFGIDLRRLNQGGVLANTSAVVELRTNGAYNAKFVKVWGCELSSNILDVAGGEVAIPQSDAVSGRVANILDIAYLTGGSDHFYMRDCYMHDAYQCINTAATNTYFVHNRMARIWDDVYTLKAYASHKYIWNYIYNKLYTPYGSGHMDSWQLSLQNFAAGIYSCDADVACNIIIRGDAGQLVSPDMQGAPFARAESAPNAFIQGLRGYGNFHNISRGTVGLIENPKDCALMWMTATFGAFRDPAGGAGTVQTVGFAGNGTYTGTFECANNITGANYNDGSSYHGNVKALIADYATWFVDPIRDGNSDKAEIIRRWTTKPGGPGDPASPLNPDGVWKGAFTPYVIHDTAAWALGVMTVAGACHASFPNGYSLNLNADDTYAPA